jgi:hypothetical protein
MNFKEFLSENDKLKAFKSFVDSMSIDKISNDFTNKEYEKYLNIAYADLTATRPVPEIITIKYEELIKAFGLMPKRNVTGSEIKYNWIITFKDGDVATVTAYVSTAFKQSIEDNIYWVVSGRDPQSYTSRIKKYIKDKGGKLLKESNKLAAFKSFVDSMGVVKISNNFTKDEYTHYINLTYPDHDTSRKKTTSGLYATYEELVKAFGIPPKVLTKSEEEIEYKWLITFKDGGVSSVGTFIYPRIGDSVEDNIYWVVGGYDPDTYNFQIKKYIKDKGGKLLRESNKLAALKGLIETQKVTDAKTKAPVIQTVEELKNLPDKSIIWYPEHDMELGTCITKDILLDYINYQQKHNFRPASKTWNVYLNGKLIDTVFYARIDNKIDVIQSLVNHDGYDPDIEIELANNMPKELEDKIEKFAKDFGAIKEYKEDELIPAVTITDEPMSFETERDEQDLDNYPDDYINFVIKAMQNGYKFYKVPYERKFVPNNIRYWWRLFD